VAKTNPGALRYIVMLMALYLHLGPFSKHVIGEIDRRITELDLAAERHLSFESISRISGRNRVGTEGAT
jgi:hypothetical protein